MKSLLENASHKTAQGIFISALILFFSIIILAAINFFTGGGVIKYFDNFKKNDQVIIDNTLTIGTAAPITSLDPLNFEFQNRMALNNIFEGLITLDPSLQVKQSLAVTFGQVDDLTWEFRLREGVHFHNGSLLSANDVIKSFDSARNSDNSQLKSVLSNIDKIEAEDGKIQIKTKHPDPTFLNKLAIVYIFKDFDNGEKYGTGPYQIDTFKDNELLLTRNNNYWSRVPVYEKASYIYIQDKSERLAKFINKDIDILRNLPIKFIDKAKEANKIIINQPSLEVTYLGFGFKTTDIFTDSRMAALLSSIIDKEKFANSFGKALTPIDQFVSSGVVGYMPNISNSTHVDIGNLLNNIKVDYFERNPEVDKFTLTLDFDLGMSDIAKFIKDELKKYNIDIVLNPLNTRDLITKLKLGDSQLYLLGWKSEFGDAIDFYKVVVHSKIGRLGEFNAGSYSHETIDKLIAKTDTEFNSYKRIKILQDIMNEITQVKPFGLPLFESQIIYAYSKDIDFYPRIDGYINLIEITPRFN